MNIVEKKEEHLVKKVSKELGFTYKELGEKIGYSESALRQAVSKNTISLPLKKAIDMQLEILQLKEEIKNYNFFKEAIKKIASS